MKPTLIKQFKQTLTDAVEQSSYTADTIPVEDPPQQVNAVLASPLGFVLDQQNPAAAAAAVAEHIVTTPSYIASIEANGPYLNATVTDTYRTDVLETLLDKTVPAADATGSVVVEHTSANPTGPLHIGSARNALIGNAVATALSYRGHDVTTQYYVNDVGLQVAVLVWAYTTMHDGGPLDAETLLTYYSEANDQLDDEALRNAVQGANSGPQEASVASTLNAIEDGETTARDMLSTVVETMLDNQLSSLQRFDITVDETVRESTFLDDGSVDHVLDLLEDNGFLQMDNGAQVVQTEAGQLVLTRSSGTSVYAARDIAFHIDKLTQYDSAVTVLGEDHEAHAAQLTDVLEMLGHATSRFTPITHAFVSTPEGAMAKREGTAVYLNDALDAAEETVTEWLVDRAVDVPIEQVAENVGQGALAYSLLSKRPSKPVTFDVETATDVDANTGPALQYAYTRCHSLLETVDGAATPTAFTHETEQTLVDTLSELPTALDTVGEGDPHVLAQYAFDVVEAFNAFYRDCQVQGSDTDTKQHRLALVQATKYVLSVVFDVLSIPTTEAM